MPSPAFDALTEMQRLEVERAMTDPAERDRILLAAVVQVRDDVSEVKREAATARNYCRENCKPALDKRLSSVEGRVAKHEGILLGTGLRAPVQSRVLTWLKAQEWGNLAKVSALAVSAGLMVGGGIGACRYSAQHGAQTAAASARGAQP